jgi:hypothetical protein
MTCLLLFVTLYFPCLFIFFGFFSHFKKVIWPIFVFSRQEFTLL